MKNYLLLSALLLAATPSFAQWTTNTEANTLVAIASTGDIQSAGTADGKTYIAFWHEVPAPQNYEMRLQLLDVDGTRLFGEAGMLVNGTVAMSTFTQIWSISVDRDNNAYVCFNGSDGGNPVHIHKIAPDGAQLWGPNGVNPGSGFDAKVLPLSNGEVIVCWLPGNKGFMQKFSANGNPVWASPVTIEPTVSNHRTSAGELAEYANGDFAVILHDRGGFSPSSLPYAQRYNANGATVWATPVALSTTFFTVFNRRYPLAQDGDNLYFGYSGAQGIQPHGFLQRINPDGSLPWGINGADFSTQTAFFEREVQIAFQDGSEAIWAICEYSDNSQGSVGEYVQKFDKTTGNRLLSNLGKEVYPVSPDYISHRGELQLIDDQPVFLISDGNSNGVFPKDILAVYLDADGNFFWPEHTRPMGTHETGVKSRIHLNRPFNGQITGAWTEDRPEVGGSRAYAQNLQFGCAGPVAAFSLGTNELQVFFTSTASNADSIFWDFGDNTTGEGNNPVHVYAEAGTYDVCQYVTNACGLDTLCQTLLVNCTPPFAEFSYTTDALEATFSSVVLNADSIAWDFGDGSNSGENNPMHLYTASGTYLVCLFAFNACEVDTFCQEVAVIVNSAGSPENDFRVQVAPNPNDGKFVLSLVLPEAAHLSYTLLTATGRQAQQQSMALGSGSQQIFIQADLPAGIYFLQVTVDGERMVLPVVVR